MRKIRFSFAIVALVVFCLAASAVAQTSRPSATGTTSPPNNFRGPPMPGSSPSKPPTKAELERKKLEKAKWMEQKQREVKADFDRRSQKTKSDLAKSKEPIPFNAGSAPPPDECLKAFIAAGRTATTMDQLMHFLPQREMESLKARQASYDPKTAATARDWHRKQDPKLNDEELSQIGGPPYNFALKFHQRLAGEILEILSVKVAGNKANLVVSTTSGATVNGQRYGYGKADIEMVGEGNYWKIARYSPSIIVYKDAPTSP